MEGCEKRSRTADGSDIVSRIFGDAPFGARGLFRGEDGIWYSRSKAAVSYPEFASEFCLTVEEESFWFQHRNRCIAAVLKLFPPPGAILDIGAGNGYVAAMVKRLGIPVVAVEPGLVAAQRARSRRGIETVVCATFENAGFPQESLPAAGLFDVLEHIADDAGFLSRVYAALAGGGRLYLSVPAGPRLWSEDDRVAGHHRRYTLVGLQRKLLQTGFRCHYSTYFFRWLPCAILMLRTLPDVVGCSAGCSLDRVGREHGASSKLVRNSILRLLSDEPRKIVRREVLGFGSSCLVVAEKPRVARGFRL